MDITLEKLKPTSSGHFRLIPNINVSARALPPAVSAQNLQSNTTLDNERPSRKLPDKEIYSFLVEVSPQEWTANPAMTLEVSFSPALFKLLTQSGVLVPSQNTPPVKIDLAAAKKLNTKVGGIQFFLEAQTFRGSPLVDKTASPIVTFRILDGLGKELLSRSTWNNNDLRTADMILVGDDAPPERIFMCELDDNQPSVRELKEAVKRAGVPLTLVPKDICNNDSWLQDQFQIGYAASPEGQQTVILHLPRMTNTSALFAGTPNLRNFTDTHFPSQTIGVVKDFWRLKTTITDGTNTLSLEVAKTFALYKQLLMAIRLLKVMFSLMLEIDPKSRPQLPGGDVTDLFAVRLAIDATRTKLLAYTNATKEQKARVLGIKPILDIVSKTLDLKAGNVVLIVPVDLRTQEFTFRADNRAALQDFFTDLNDLHSSRNYGGNIEVSRPHPGALFGTILAGSVTSTALREFLTSRGSSHPFAEVNTEWLEVGHIDEIAAFVAMGPDHFCVVRAAPKLALDMLDRLVAAQAKGIQVTRLFRGKKWMHESKPGATDPHLPPNAYRRLLVSKRYDLSGFEKKIPTNPKPTFGDAVYHDDRQYLIFNRMLEADARYAAMITCADLADVCRATNRAVEDLFLSKSTYALNDDQAYKPYLDNPHYRKEVLPRRLDKVLDEQFRGTPVFPIPVLFDWVQDFFNSSTSAVMPAMVNLQTLGQHILVPRPLGARMPIADAVVFMNELFAKTGFPKAKIDESFIRTRGLDKTWHWTRSVERVHHAGLRSLPTDFDPEYPEYNLSVQRHAASTGALDPGKDLYTMMHGNDPMSNHPDWDFETLRYIANYFKDGFPEFKNVPVDFCKGDTEQAHPKFDKYEADLKVVMDRIRKANPNTFDQDGKVISEDWKRIVIPEDTADVFELYTQALLETFGLTVHWVDSWFYHLHFGGIHCGTNVLRSAAGRV
jgi:hypothetical protein